jgi:hypothetical protein
VAGTLVARGGKVVHERVVALLEAHDTPAPGEPAS